MEDALDRTIAAVRAEVIPTEEEREALSAVIDEVLARAEAAIGDIESAIDVVLVGSTARDTWLRGERDIDVFVRFDPALDRDELERLGLRVCQEVLPDGRQEYAEHPYVTGDVDGYSVDVVPCYRVASGSEIRSSVDRTPFHAEYVTERLTPELANEVRLLKQFCDAHGLYGSDLRTLGLSGYLTELLVLEYGSFRAVVEAAADWTPPVEIDPADHGEATFDDPLVMIDPTDPARNVAAVVSDRTVARLQHYARELLADPDERWFRPRPREPLAAGDLMGHVARRETTPVAVTFPAPDLVEDELYPQLRTTRRSVAAALNARGFDVVRGAAYADDRALLYYELGVAERPAIERHDGPPVHVREHATAFLEKYRDADVYGPFIDGDRYVVERERTWTDAAAFLRSDALLNLRIGADLEPPFRDDRTVHLGPAVADLVPAFGAELATFYDPIP